MFKNKSFCSHGFDIIGGAFMCAALFLLSCNSLKRTAKKENRAANEVRNNARLTNALKGYFMAKNPCVNDTVKTVTYIDSTDILAGLNTLQLLHDTIIIEQIKYETKYDSTKDYVGYINFLKEKNNEMYARLKKPLIVTKYVDNLITDNRFVNLYKDSLEFYKQRLYVANTVYEKLETEHNILKAQKNGLVFGYVVLAILSAFFVFLTFKLKR